jgi:hypothetical protein
VADTLPVTDRVQGALEAAEDGEEESDVDTDNVCTLDEVIVTRLEGEAV